MLAIVLLSVVGCLFFIIASIRFKKQLAKQEEEMANLRATRRQQARDRELAMEEFLDLQEKWRLDLIQEHFEFHTIPPPASSTSITDDVSAAGRNDKEDNKNEKVENVDRDKTDVTLSSSSYDETDDDEEQQQQQQRKERSNSEETTSTDTTEPCLVSIRTESDDVPEDSPQQAPSPSDDTSKNSSTGIFSSWLTSLYRPQQQQQQQNSKDGEEDDCCCICLEGYRPDDTVCLAKNSSCHHMFHKECALQWFMGNVNHNECPMCRITVLPNTLDFDDDLICLRVSNPSQQEQQEQQDIESSLSSREQAATNNTGNVVEPPTLQQHGR